jgi:hypothetical protein
MARSVQMNLRVRPALKAKLEKKGQAKEALSASKIRVAADQAATQALSRNPNPFLLKFADGDDPPS